MKNSSKPSAGGESANRGGVPKRVGTTSRPGQSTKGPGGYGMPGSKRPSPKRIGGK